MPDVLVTTGVPHMAHQNITSPYANKETGWEQITNLGRGIVDENIVFKGAKYVVENIFHTRPDLFKVDPQYDPYYDPQLFKYKELMGNFLHSKSKEHTSYLIERFIDKNKKINGSPFYIIGRILGGITDPSSLFLFTKAGNILLTGSRLSRSAKFGAIIGGEEAGKRFFDDTRPMTESTMITAGAVIIPALFPAINNKMASKKFDDYADMLDEVDNVTFGSSTVGAAQMKVDPKKVTKLNEMNQIQPTGLGVFGEQGPWNPVFRVLKRNMLAAQDFIENVLEIPLYQRKNFADGVTNPSIERSVK